MFRSNKVLMAFSLIFAIALWMYVMGVVNPSTTRQFANVRVSVVNERMLAGSGLEIANRKDLTVDIRVKAPRTVMKDVKDGKMSAYVRLKKIRKGSQTLDVRVTLPNDAVMTGISDDELKVRIREIPEKTESKNTGIKEREKKK